MLASPIILYDDPKIAPESAGNLFDSTEIDEILSLRILTLTDQEKLEIRQSDERARELLERTESIPERTVLEASWRAPRPDRREGGFRMNEWEWNLLEDKATVDRIEIGGIKVKAGDRVGCARRTAATFWTLHCADKLQPLSALKRTTRERNTFRWFWRTIQGAILA